MGGCCDSSPEPSLSLRETISLSMRSISGRLTLAVAIVGLIASLFIPQAYCRYGCPTGALLEFVRSHGAHDRVGRRDIAAGLMVVLVALIWWKFPLINAWLLVAG